MIIWVTGRRGAGKTTLARELCQKMDALNLDGDDMRASITGELGYTAKDRMTNNIKIAKLAKVLEEQGIDVIVSTICPEYVRQQVKHISKCKFIHL